MLIIPIAEGKPRKVNPKMQKRKKIEEGKQERKRPSGVSRRGTGPGSWD